MNLKEALKAAIDGKEIRLPTWVCDDFVRWNLYYFVDNRGGSWRCLKEDMDSTNWEIFKEPLKYIVDVWLSNVPTPKSFNDTLSGYLFGRIGWDRKPFGESKKYKITVEGVVE
jgi:hypothetical protein